MTLHIRKMKLLYTPNFMFVDASVIEFREFNRKRRSLNNMGPLSGHCEINITSITCILQDNFDLFIDIISFQHVIHFGVGRIEIEWNMEVKMEILVFA